jgi:hypothetical protein
MILKRNRGRRFTGLAAREPSPDFTADESDHPQGVKAFMLANAIEVVHSITPAITQSNHVRTPSTIL